MREAAIQRGPRTTASRCPSSTSRPPPYLDLFHETLTRRATRVAHAVARCHEVVLAGRQRPGLVSLAGRVLPIGILMRRWAAYAHGVDLPHYTISIVRGRGIDRVALRHLAQRYDPARVVFVDGWTGRARSAGS